ncbi:Protein of unknown function (DUF3558) [Streptoalloteichus tenebrarius]|uniref:DUF3558 domain-containing protein n=2 Tax=Streptoalloteichus tenebrarius (strain ATCC 17920 / DSM 40477 / JCM 4838 / CBS 697.72 / NBRC 16177 / NCIMB 11028 / NRRL B-12390 / A12253. 1 / ISP 5477) TaxID=1933 RepID=A0ABT1I3U7_STRSD|nr:Protein of unknown function (DUF3558) [Streptoalloteichus tenebrarius]
MTHMRRFSPSILCLAAAAMVMAGCTSTTPGQASTSTGSQSSAATGNGAPKVTNPKNLKAIADPCQLLTPQQLQEIGASESRPGKSPWGEESCTWRNDNLNLAIAPDTTQNQGLSILYANKKSDSEETTVNGHPSLRYNKEGRSCALGVGVSDTQTFSISMTVLRDVKPEYKDRCAFAEKVAGMVLSNLPPAS